MWRRVAVAGMGEFGYVPDFLRSYDPEGVASGDVRMLLRMVADVVEFQSGRAEGWFAEFLRCVERESLAVRVAALLAEVLERYAVEHGVEGESEVVNALSEHVRLLISLDEHRRSLGSTPGGGFDHPSGLR